MLKCIIFSGETSEKELLNHAMAESNPSTGIVRSPANSELPIDVSNLTEEEQLTYAMQLSMRDCGKHKLIFYLFYLY